MNQSLLDNSGGRQARKRSSYEAIKSSFSLKNGKKSLPEVCIDLNQHHKKQRLALQQQRSGKDNIACFEISQFNQTKKAAGKVYKKKDQLMLNHLHNTDLVRPNNENKNILNQYRDEIQLLKLQNQRLKEENQRYRKSQEYLARRIKETQLQGQAERQQLREYAEGLEAKLQKYSGKIKHLFEELIRLKKQGEEQEMVETETRQKERSRERVRGELYSQRVQEGTGQAERRKRLTSPSDLERHKTQWMEEMQNLAQFEKRGEEAYYRMDKRLYGTFRSSGYQ